MSKYPHDRIDAFFDGLEAKLKAADAFIIRQLPVLAAGLVGFAVWRAYIGDWWYAFIDVLFSITTIVFWRQAKRLGL